MSRDSGMTLSILLRARDMVSGPVSRMRARLQGFRSQAQDIGRRVGFERISRSLGRARVAASELYGAAARLARRLVLVGSLGAAAMGGMAISLAGSGDELAKFADQMGFGIVELQQWQYAAERMGVSQEQFNSSLSSFARRLAEARNGQGELYSSLRDTHPQLLAQLEAAENIEDALSIYMRAMEGATDELERGKLATDGFGRSGQVMARMVRDGTGELDNLRARALELGHVIGEDTARQAEEFSDQMLDMRRSLMGVRNTIGGALMPVMGDLMVQLTDLVVRYQPQIQAWATSFAETLPQRLGELRDGFFAVRDTVEPLISAGAWLVERFGGVEVAATAVGLYFGGPFLLALGKLGIAMTQLGVVFLTNPIGLVVAAIAAAAYLLISNWETIGPFFSDLWDTVVSYAGVAWDFLKSMFEWSPLGLLMSGFGAAVDWLSSIDWSGHGAALLETLASGISSAVMAPVTAVRDGLARIRRLLPFSDAREGPLSELTASGAAIPGTLAEGVERGGPGLLGALSGVAEQAQRILSGGFDRLGSFFGFGGGSGEGAQAQPLNESGGGMASGSRGGVHVDRIDFSPVITIEAGDLDAEGLADLIDERLQRWRDREMWRAAQSLAEG
jgi:hypothetical protein